MFYNTEINLNLFFLCSFMSGVLRIYKHDDPLFWSGVTGLYVTIEYLSKIDKTVFYIAIGN